MKSSYYLTLKELDGLQMNQIVRRFFGLVTKRRSNQISLSKICASLMLQLLATATCRLTVWQEMIDILEQEKCYKMENLFVCSFDGVTYLTPPKTGFKMTEVGKIGMVEDLPEEDKNEIRSAEVEKNRPKITDTTYSHCTAVMEEE